MGLGVEEERFSSCSFGGFVNYLYSGNATLQDVDA